MHVLAQVMRRDVAVCELPGRERSHGGGVPGRQFSLIASWNERCETDLFAGTFAGSVPEPACISQLCVCETRLKNQKSRTLVQGEGGFTKRVRAMAI